MTRPSSQPGCFLEYEIVAWHWQDLLQVAVLHVTTVGALHLCEEKRCDVMQSSLFDRLIDDRNCIWANLDADKKSLPTSLVVWLEGRVISLFSHSS